MRLLVFIVMAAAANGSPVQRCPASARREVNPYEGDDRSRRAGAKLFERECAACHGPSGQGRGRAPALTGRDMRESAPGAVHWVLRNGSIYRGMPSFSHLPDQQLWQIVTYVKSLPKP